MRLRRTGYDKSIPSPPMPAPSPKERYPESTRLRRVHQNNAGPLLEYAARRRLGGHEVSPRIGGNGERERLQRELGERDALHTLASDLRRGDPNCVERHVGVVSSAPSVVAAATLAGQGKVQPTVAAYAVVLASMTTLLSNVPAMQIAGRNRSSSMRIALLSGAIALAGVIGLLLELAFRGHP
jgi:hypothetical protein